MKIHELLEVSEDTEIVDCPHEDRKGTLSFVTREDALWLADRLGITHDGKIALRVCRDCYRSTPSEVAREARFEARRLEAIAEREAHTAEVLAAAEQPVRCIHCDEVFDLVDAVPVRYCSFCESCFDGTNGRNCETCNRPFTRNCHFVAHESCAGSCDPDDEDTYSMLEA